MTTAFENYQSKAKGLFSVPDLGQISFEKHEKFRDDTGSMKISASSELVADDGIGVTTGVSPAPLNWAIKLSNPSSDSNNVSFDTTWNHQNKVEHNISLNFENCSSEEEKRSFSSKFSINPIWDGHTGKTAWNDLTANFSMENFFHLKLATPIFQVASSDRNLSIEASIAPFKKEQSTLNLSNLNLGFSGDLNQNGLENGKIGFHNFRNGLEMAFVSNDLQNPHCGEATMFMDLANHKYFNAYGVEYSGGVTGGLAIAAESSKNGLKFKVDNKGILNIVKNFQINKSVQLNLASEVDLTEINGGGYKFGAGVVFE